MVATQTTQANLPVYFMCDDRSRLTVDEQKMHLKVDRDDASIADKVDSALWKNSMLRSTDYRQIDIAVKDGVVFLSGHVINATNQQQAEAAARTIRGVLEVKNYLVPDDKLLWVVAGALGKIEHLYKVKFFTGVQNGVVGLNGKVSTTTVRRLAEICAANIPGVRGVINSIRVTGVELEPEDQHFLQPSIGELIYFRGGLSGTVQKVIMNPSNRRVVAMVVRGRFSSSQQDPRFMAYSKGQTLERLIAIPMSAIRTLTKNSGFLQISNAEAVQYGDFDPSCFVAPREDWIPPYPYCRDDILFSAESVENMNQTEGMLAFIPVIFPWTNTSIRSNSQG